MFNHLESTVYFRDDFMPYSEAQIGLSSASVLYGLGVFTGMRAMKNPKTGNLNLFRADEHFDRLRFSAKMLRYKNFLNSYTAAQFVEILKEVLVRNEITEEVYLRVSVFSDEEKITPKLNYNDTLSVFAYPLPDYISLDGVRCKTASWQRVSDNAIPARAKITGLYVNTALAKAEANNAGYDEALFLNDRGHVVEGSAQNIFMVSDGVLITPPKSDNILEGITRMTVLELAQDKGIPVLERSIARTELLRADEVFLTGSATKVVPVIEIDNYSVGTGSVGPISSLIQEVYIGAARGELHEYRKWIEEVKTPSL